MEKKQLLLISKNEKFVTDLKKESGLHYELTIVRSIHAGYTLALSYLPDVVLVDCVSMEAACLKNLKNFKSTHFLNRSFLFLYGPRQKKTELESTYREDVDGLFYDNEDSRMLFTRIEKALRTKGCLTNYWRDSFMGLFNLLENPVILLQDEEIIAMNDAFKHYFYISDPEGANITDFIDCKSKFRVLETLRNFVRGKHMKASTRSSLLMNGKKRDAKICFSKVDTALRGQMIMMINFCERESSFNEQIGTASRKTEEYFENNHTTGMGNLSFTKREKEIIGLLCKGYKTKEISNVLCISAKTIEKHRSNIIRRTNSDTILESVVYALNNKMIEI